MTHPGIDRWVGALPLSLVKCQCSGLLHMAVSCRVQHRRLLVGWWLWLPSPCTYVSPDPETPCLGCLQDLVGKNLTYISQLDGLTFDLYSTSVLPRLLEQVSPCLAPRAARQAGMLYSLPAMLRHISMDRGSVFASLVVAIEHPQARLCSSRHTHIQSCQPA